MHATNPRLLLGLAALASLAAACEATDVQQRGSDLLPLTAEAEPGPASESSPVAGSAEQASPKQASPKQGLELLLLHSNSETVRSASTPMAAYVYVVNHGPERARFLLPGEGSHVGWRTPSIEWTVTNANGNEFEQRGSLKCGMIAPHTPDEIVTLEAGETRQLTSDVGQPQLPRLSSARPHTISVRYVHDPEMKWVSGARHVPQDQRASLRGVPPLTLVSNTIRVE